jgi:sterol desaturase/sphingolipid hydroxylase (fatty acid hydroxylase superfamily)
MDIFDEVIHNLYLLPFWQAVLWITLENVSIFLLSLAFGHMLIKLFRQHSVSLAAKPNALEWFLAVGCVLLNIVVTTLGLLLWRGGVINLRQSLDWRSGLDILVLFLTMDFLMYIFHRVAHLRLFFRYIHSTHHIFTEVRPLTLFALNPLENFGFGALWLVVITVYQASWLGITVYLSLNIIFGLIGHLGVEPFPSWWVKVPIIKLISTSTFHAQHHQEISYNFGFYTLFWDKLFGTLSPHYPQNFAKLPQSELTPAFN